ncbi:MAG: matrixin family metalloprotease, partial [Devosia sp.]
LTDYSWADTGTLKTPVIVTYSFDKKLRDYQKDDPAYTSKVAKTFGALNATEKSLAKQAFKEWSDASGIRFVEVPTGKGDIALARIDFTHLKFGGQDYGPFAGYASYPSRGVWVDDSTWGSQSYSQPVSGDLFLNSKLGTASRLTIAHEIGHAIGLKHPHDGPTTLAKDLDNSGNTVMSYNHTDRSGSLGKFDKEAAQAVYGTARLKSDTLKSYKYEGDVLSQKWGAAGNVIAGSSSKDSIDAGGGHDTLLGHEGNDSLKGGSGQDFLLGGKGKDVLDGGKGADRLTGEAGNDTFVFALGYGSDLIEDFNLSDGDQDVVVLNRSLWGGGALTAQQVIELYGNDEDYDSFLLDFGNGDVLTFNGAYAPDVEAAIRII